MNAGTLCGRKAALHEELVKRARDAQDQVFGDASVDAYVLVDSLRHLCDRIIAQLEAMAKETGGGGKGT